MFLSPRLESDELKVYRYLEARMELNSKEKQQYINLTKGLEGELQFDRLLEQLGERFLILSDLLLEKQNTFFQIDSLLISHDTIFLFEVKNYEGDYYIEDDKWFSCAGSEIQNPLIQLKRSESLLRRFLQSYQLSYQIKAFLIFINPEFTLYQAPLNKTIIFHSQLKRFMNELSLRKVPIREKHMQLAQKILSEHQEKSPYARLPIYQYGQLQKGIGCVGCTSIETRSDAASLVCDRCGSVENIDSALIRNAEEFTILFPDKKLTTNAVHEWSGEIVSKKTIRRVLRKNYILIGHGRTSHFIKK